MRVPLRESTISGFSIALTKQYPQNWIIRDMRSAPIKNVTYAYSSAAVFEDKFFEDGLIYNADGSLADNEMLWKINYFHSFLHASLNTLLEQPIPSLPDNRLYGLHAGYRSNLRRIASVRDRLSVPDWVALLIVAKIIDEDSIRTMLIDVPDLFTIYPLEWLILFLGVTVDSINSFGVFDGDGSRILSYRPDNFDNFCKIIELEKQYASSVLKVGSV